MRKTEQVTKDYLECDGCKYILGLTTDEKEAGVDIFDRVATLTIPWGGQNLEFHFHVTRGRHDCFRYWAHNPGVMKFSLEERDFEHEDIESFMEMFLYRETSFAPGVEREAV